jgi:hypothetical protein
MNYPSIVGERGFCVKVQYAEQMTEGEMSNIEDSTSSAERKEKLSEWRGVGQSGCQKWFWQAGGEGDVPDVTCYLKRD